MKNCFIGVLACLLFSAAMAQTDSTDKVRLHVGGFVESYYGLDGAMADNHLRPCFLYNHHRTNEFAVNMALVQLSAESDRFRAHVGLMTGTYPQANLASEPAVMRHIYEANAGVALGKSGRTWLDVGVMPSYIGFEGAISTDNLTLSRSLCAENSPYFVTGARLGTHLGKRWELAAYLLNGWQHIRMAYGARIPSLGTQARFQAKDKLLLNWSTFIGSDDTDRAWRLRLFSNLYAQAQPSERLSLTAGFDVGMQQQAQGSSTMQLWFSPALIGRYKIAARTALVARAEYYSDPNGVMVSCTNSPSGMQTAGASLGADYQPHPHVWLRVEGRTLYARSDIFRLDGQNSPWNPSLLASIAVRIP